MCVLFWVGYDADELGAVCCGIGVGVVGAAKGNTRRWEEDLFFLVYYIYLGFYWRLR